MMKKRNEFAKNEVYLFLFIENSNRNRAAMSNDFAKFSMSNDFARFLLLAIQLKRKSSNELAKIEVYCHFW